MKLFFHFIATLQQLPPKGRARGRFSARRACVALMKFGEIGVVQQCPVWQFQTKAR